MKFDVYTIDSETSENVFIGTYEAKTALGALHVMQDEKKINSHPDHFAVPNGTPAVENRSAGFDSDNL